VEAVKRAAHFSQSKLVEAIRSVGVRAGDVVFSHVAMGMLGFPEEGSTEEAAFGVIYNAFMEVLGPEGTLLIPTYSYSFCNGENFNPNTTPSEVGPFTERFRKLEGVRRNLDPIFSVAGCGPRVGELFRDLPHNCFGNDCIYQRMIHIGAKICNIGVGVRYSTFIHHVEQMEGVPYRFLKLFTGRIEGGGEPRKEGWLYNVRILAGSGYPELGRLEKKARATKVCRVAPVGLGEVVCIDCADLYQLASAEIAKDPWYLAKGPAGDPVELERERVKGKTYQVSLPRDASMEEMIEALWRLPRDIVSDGYDAALEALAKQVPMTVHQYPTGKECWTWIIPEKWTCHEAYLETLDGRRLLSSTDNPLHVVSYSLPFEGEVSRQELFDHLHDHPKIPDAIPFNFKYYERDWGLCCTKNSKDSLTEERYRVVIKTSFSYSTLKVGEVVVPGESEECIVLCAHLCHPAMAEDDLSGVVVGLEVMRKLLKRRHRHYTYRFLIVPETIGSIAYLSHNEALIPKMKGGLFLEMLGLENPYALQLSFYGNTELDQRFTLAVRDHDSSSWTGAFRTVIGNDERQFNAPGVRVPMLSLSRVLPLSDPDWPYREYHSSQDTPALVSTERLKDSCDLVLRMIDSIESNPLKGSKSPRSQTRRDIKSSGAEDSLVPLNKFKGEVFCSRYGLHIDWYSDPKGNKVLFDIIHLIDGTRSVAEIALTCNVSFEVAKKIIDDLHRHGLVEYRGTANLRVKRT
jgi:aminopeptidase-like protein/aminoglycoside N3'-acetyltransferase